MYNSELAEVHCKKVNQTSHLIWRAGSDCDLNSGTTIIMKMDSLLSLKVELYVKPVSCSIERALPVSDSEAT